MIKSLTCVSEGVTLHIYTLRLKTDLAAAGKYKQQPNFLLIAFCRSSASVVRSDRLITSNSGQWKASGQSFQYEGYNTAHTFPRNKSVIVTLLPRKLFPTRPERPTETRRERADTRMCK